MTDLFEKLFGKEPEEGYVFKSIEVTVGNRAIIISWLVQGIGFGELALYIEDGKIKIDTEQMNKEFCDALVTETVKKLSEEHTSKKLSEEDDYFFRGKEINHLFLETMYKNVTW